VRRARLGIRPTAAYRLSVAMLCAVAVSLAGTASAAAHAQLLGTSPQSGATVPVQPAEVIFKFNQAVGGTLGAVRVYDAQGEEVDNLDVAHPEGQEHWMGVGLKPHLPDGTYTATYRVISADTHIVYGGLVFNIGHAGAAPKFTVAGLIERNKSGEVTTLAFGVVRALNYLSIALLLGGLAFLGLAWRPGLADVAGTAAASGSVGVTAASGGEARWRACEQALARRMEQLLVLAVLIGVAVSAVGVLLQGASAAGVSLWSSLKAVILENTLESRFGEVWGARALDWLILGALLLVAGALRRRSSSWTPSSGRTPHHEPRHGSALAEGSWREPRWLLALIVLAAAYLAATPALAGHASIQSPTGVFFPADVLHVLAAGIWVGGIACLLFVLPTATRRLEGPERSRLLLAVLVRFSRVALIAVAVIAVTGVVQAYIDVRTFTGLLHTTYGALILVKTALLLVLIALGWVNRTRVLPGLEALVDAVRAPGGIGVLARRTLRGELALMLCVFGVTAALIAYAPPIDAASGPFSTNTTLGPAELELTVEPARVGLNTIHLYLINAKDGTQFTATKELIAKAALPAKGIGPLPLQANLAGPGHYVLNSAELSPEGTWEIQLTDRISEFEEYTQTVKVPIG
jgi:copper transport protein